MKIEFSKTAAKDFKGLDSITQKRVRHLLQTIQQGPKAWPLVGKRLKGPLSHVWSFRIGDYRLLGIQEDERMVFIALRIAHRRFVYDRH